MENLKGAVVVGAGISGLACAYRLRQSSVPVTLLEASDSPGGMIGSISQNGFLFERGPQSFLGTPALLDLIRALGIENELVRSDPRAPRYVLMHGTLHAIPMSPGALLTSSLLTPGSRFRIVSEAFRHSHAPTEEESVAAFVRRKFGHEILEYLVTPFVSGVYAGDPEELSLKSAFPSLSEWEEQYGSVIRGVMKSRPPKGTPRPSLCSFKHGLHTLTDALRKSLGESVRMGVRVDSLTRTADGTGSRFVLRMATGSATNGSPAEISTESVILATPAYIAGHLVHTISEDIARFLKGIAYAPVAVIAAAYRCMQIGNPLQGFGFLVPRSERRRLLGTVFNSSLFPGRATEGMATLTSFAGGATDREIVEMDPDQIRKLVEADNEKILEISGEPVERAIWRYPKALPQYNLGHAETLRAISDRIGQIPGLFLSGNYLDGPSIGNCIQQGFRTADSAREFLATPSAQPV